jgi:biotin transport system ATP-binding protein
MILEARHLHLHLAADQPILSDVSFEMNEGELLIIAGRNGSGKTMLLRLIKGLIPLTGGSLWIDQKDLSRRPKERNRHIGLVFQDADTQLVGQTVQKDLLFGLENLEFSPQQSTLLVDEIAQKLELTHLLTRRPRSLSGGEKRRVAIAAVLLMRPRLLLLDEPFANLDYPAVVQVLQSLLALKKEGVSIIVATHELEKILAHSDTLLLLDQGNVIGVGKPHDIIENIESCGIRRPHFRQEPLPIEEMTWLK